MGCKVRSKLGRAKVMGAVDERGRFLPTHGHTVGLTRSPTWRSWSGMLDRCTNPKDPSYAQYGGRGIVVCNRWLKFENFLADMGTRPEGMTLERAKNDEYYGPLNCVWATKGEQARNRRSNHNIEINGVTKCLADWCQEYGLAHALVRWRLRHGWSIIEAVTTPTGVRTRWKES
jgi:hypothetical protein